MTHSPPGFTGGKRIDRADQLRTDPDGLRAAMTRPSARLLSLNGLNPLFGDDGRLAWTSIAEADPEAELLLLGLDGDTPCFAQIAGGGDRPLPAPRLWHALASLPPDEAALYAAARSLIDWHLRHGFCAQCGAGTRIVKAGWGRLCPDCGAEHYPRVDPVAIMLPEHDGKVLVGRQPRFPPKSFSALAGFIEPGESLEEAVARELWEEAGITVHGVRYVTSQPWPFPSSLMIGCTAVTDDPALTLDETEIEDAFWASEADVRAALEGDEAAPFVAPPRFAIAHNLFQHWLSTRG